MMKEKIRVLHIIPNFGPGGAERLVVDLMQAADKERFEVAAVSLYPESGTILEREIRAKGLKVYYLGKHKGLDLRMIPRLYRLFRAFRPNVVHTHLYVLRYVLLHALFCRIPVRVHTVHSVAPKEVDRVGKLVQWFAFRLGGVVPVGISQMVASTIKNLYGRSIFVPVIYNGIPTGRFVSGVINADIKKNRELILLHVGRFASAKNHQFLIEAFAIAFKEVPQMRLWLVGDGPLRPAVESRIRELGLEEEVSFLGIRDDIPELLAEADIFVLPSDWEGVPLTVLEAMAAGKPVIATAVGGVPELVEDGVTGILVPPRDARALAQEIIRLARDPDLRRAMGEAGQKKAVERFDISRTARGYEDLYVKLLMEGGRK